MEKIRIVIAEDHPLVRKGTGQLLEQYPDFEIAGEAGTGEEALELLKRLQPDILICDVRLPELDGIEVVRRIKECSPGTRALMLTAYDDDDYIVASLRGGASGYLLKTVDLNELAEAIRAVHAGQTVLNPQVAARMTHLWTQDKPVARQREKLSRREREVLRLVARKKGTSAIADELGLSVRTVEVYLGRIFAKLAVSSRAEAVAYSISHNIIDLADEDDGREEK